MKKLLGFCTLLTISYAGALQAQPDLNNAPKAVNPQNRAVLTREQRIRTQITERLRPELTRAGLTDTAQQDAVIKFFIAEVEGRGALAQEGRQLAQAIQNGALTDNQLASATNNYQGAIEDEKIRHQAAVAALKKSVDYNKFPKLAALLTVIGFVGDGPTVNGGPLGNLINLGGRQNRNQPAANAGNNAGGGANPFVGNNERPRRNP